MIDLFVIKTIGLDESKRIFAIWPSNKKNVILLMMELNLKRTLSVGDILKNLET